MRKIILFICFCLYALFFTGCESLPPGDAPAGPIVKPRPAIERFPWQSARNYMLTSLTTFCLQNSPQGVSLCVDIKGDEGDHGVWTYDVLSSLRKTLPVRITARSNAEYVLESGMDKENFWYMRLINSKVGKKVWSERLRIKENE